MKIKNIVAVSIAALLMAGCYTTQAVSQGDSRKVAVVTFHEYAPMETTQNFYYPFWYQIAAEQAQASDNKGELSSGFTAGQMNVFINGTDVVRRSMGLTTLLSKGMNVAGLVGGLLAPPDSKEDEAGKISRLYVSEFMSGKFIYAIRPLSGEMPFREEAVSTFTLNIPSYDVLSTNACKFQHPVQFNADVISDKEMRGYGRDQDSNYKQKSCIGFKVSDIQSPGLLKYLDGKSKRYAEFIIPNYFRDGKRDESMKLLHDFVGAEGSIIYRSEDKEHIVVEHAGETRQYPLPLNPFKKS
jgi:hypothetical protein